MRKKDNRIRDIATTGIALALVVIMASTPFGTITLPTVEITIAFVPVLVVAMVSPLPYVIIVSVGSGVVSMLVCLLMSPTVLAPFIANPLVSVLPRAFIGPAAFLVYKGLSALFGKRRGGATAAAVVGAAVGSLVNTVGVLSMLYFVYQYDLNLIFNDTANGAAAQSVGKILLMIAFGNGILEMVASAIIVGAVVAALKRSVYRGAL